MFQLPQKGFLGFLEWARVELSPFLALRENCWMISWIIGWYWWETPSPYVHECNFFQWCLSFAERKIPNVSDVIIAVFSPQMLLWFGNFWAFCVYIIKSKFLDRCGGWRNLPCGIQKRVVVASRSSACLGFLHYFLTNALLRCCVPCKCKHFCRNKRRSFPLHCIDTKPRCCIIFTARSIPIIAQRAC